VRVGRQEPRAEDDVGVAVEQGLQELGQIGGVVLEVGVLHGDEGTGRVREPGPQGRPLAAVHEVTQHPDTGIADAGQDRRRAVGRRVIDHDHFGDERLRQHAFQRPRHRGFLVVARDDHGEAWLGHRGRHGGGA
jgi:hypothetical protein